MLRNYAVDHPHQVVLKRLQFFYLRWCFLAVKSVIFVIVLGFCVRVLVGAVALEKKERAPSHASNNTFYFLYKSHLILVGCRYRDISQRISQGRLPHRSRGFAYQERVLNLKEQYKLQYSQQTEKSSMRLQSSEYRKNKNRPRLQVTTLSFMFRKQSSGNFQEPNNQPLYNITNALC